MKCLVTGATGFIGGELCRRLRQRGVEVAETGRESPGDEQLSGCQLVFHAAGVAHRAASAADYEAFNHSATLDLASRALKAGVRRFVFLSSVNAGPDAEPYGFWKWTTEQALTADYAGTSMQVVHVRPALVYGPGAKANLKLLIAAVRRGLPMPPVGSPRSMVGLGDLCEALTLLLDVDPGHGQVLVASDGQAYDIQRIVRAFAVAAGRSPGEPWLPRWCWRSGCFLLDVIRRRTPGASYEQLFGGDEHSNTALREALGWQPTQCLEDVAAAMVEAQD